MCGICGKLNFRSDAPPMDAGLLRQMTDAISHRGPDDQGLYISGGVGLGNRRLRIIDLKTGRQPISNEDGSIWVVYNGEIYNYKKLKSFLLSRGHIFRTATDTEVIVHLYEEFGDECIQQLTGMFSFALWDERNKKLLLARDRVGIKPLYYCLTADSLVFGSEIKSILCDPSIMVCPDPVSVDRFLTYLYVPGEDTLFKGISKLLPGHYMVVKDAAVTVRRYWDLSFAKTSDRRGLKDIQKDLDDLLTQIVCDHMVADVPVGVLLSGGVDSSAMLSYAVEHTGKQVSTFTVGFEGQGIVDERPYARLVADRYGSQHFETTITAQEFLDCLPRYLWHMEEPVCEPPAIALYYVTKLAREHVTVLLSGEGGDEAFAGYQNYRNLYWLETFKSQLGALAHPASLAADKLGHVPGFGRIRKYAPLMSIPFNKYYYSRTGNPFALFNGVKHTLYSQAFRHEAHLNGNGIPMVPTRYASGTASLDPLDRMLYVDTMTWLPDDLLIKADKMTMANSVELRVPFLDHRVLEYAAGLPRDYKLRGTTTKYILKKALSHRLPKEILHRKKTGFPVPYEGWIRRELYDFVFGVLTDNRTIQRGYFETRAVERLLKGNSNGADHSKELFSLVVLELWHRTFVDKSLHSN